MSMCLCDVYVICVYVICVVCICMWHVVCMASPVYAQYFSHPLDYMRSMMTWSVYKGFSHLSHCDFGGKSVGI